MESYESVIRSLNGRQKPLSAPADKLPEDQRKRQSQLRLLRLASKLGVGDDELSSLRIVHVAGTKGKGSVCSFVESILRRSGRRTGFLSSPHLQEVRERIRIEGRPLAKEKFVEYFRLVEACIRQDEEESGRLTYLQLLTLMAFVAFANEKVDVAVVEVGMGGRYDITNFFPSPWVCAVTSLGKDHTEHLGDSLSEIAWHKAGIMKPGCVAVTVEQVPECLPVLKAEAKAVGCDLVESQLLESPVVGSRSLESYQVLNASLAVTVCRLWLQRWTSELGQSGFSPAAAHSEVFELGLETARWPGRCQTVEDPVDQSGVTFFIDGAHTVESTTLAGRWFAEKTKADKDCRLALIFNKSGPRQPEYLLKPLMDSVTFDLAVFTPSTAFGEQDREKEDVKNFKVTREEMMLAVRQNRQVFERLLEESRQTSTTTTTVVETVDCVDEAAELVRRREGKWKVLVTGSLYLVGCIHQVIGIGVDDY